MKKDIKLKEANLVRAYRNVFGTEDGEVVLADLIKRFRVLDSSYYPGDDANKVLFNEGARGVVLTIMTMTKRDERALLKMIEQGEKENADYDYITTYR